MNEEYRIIFQHYFVTDSGERFKVDEPIIVEQIFTRNIGGSPIIINRLFDEAKHYTLMKMSEPPKEENNEQNPT